MNRFVFAFLAVSVLLGFVFFYIPQIDVWVAGLFYSPGRGFVFEGSRAVALLRRVMVWGSQLLVTVCLVLLVINMIRCYLLKKETPFLASNRSVIYVLLALGLGPGLVVNAIFKDHWGRARPHEVVAFGGNQRFTQAFVLSDQCKTNCSFVSGEAALGFFGLTFLFVAQRRRKVIAIVSIFLGSLLGLVRMAQGDHFFSDVIFSGVFTLTVSYLLYLLIIGDRRKKRFTNIRDDAI